jgi:hypothetical protein
MAGPKRVGCLIVGCIAAVAGACDPYERFGKNNDHLGPVDPVNFPPANVGVGGDRLRAGRGSFTEVRAFAGGMPVGYFPYTVPGMASDPIRVLDGMTPTLPTPPAYVFSNGCVPPPGYVWSDETSPVTEDHRKDQQGHVLSALPAVVYRPGVAPVSSYVPVVAEVPVSASGRPCQQFKSEKQLVDTLRKEMGKKEDEFSAADIPRSGKYHAWLVIDPAAAVYPLGQSAATKHEGVGLQKWGWYNRYLAAYLDGGEILTRQVMVMEGMPPAAKMVTRMVTQRLFYPRSPVIGMNAAGMPTMAPGARGAGYDVLEFRKGEAGYSPVCQVFTYHTGTPMAAADLPKDVATIEAMFNPPPNPMDPTVEPIRPAMPPYVYCLQVR